MRVIAGDYRGRTLKALKGDTTRPTTDRVKESLMSALVSATGGFEDLCVLDAFAGSGQLGIEALSRGAARVCFCEQGRDALRIVESNLNACKVDRSRYQVLRSDSLKLPQRSGLPQFDLVFLDPPYAFEAKQVFEWIRAMDEAGKLAKDAVVSYEYDRKSAQEVSVEVDALKWTTVSARTYGDTAVVILRRS
ncbi:MAG: 16S rRNA (guanine(966)-N(2))-methyltransferase RsmD [Coriobacteriia bacterium]|nr:16S rRNA (guanine(966)-N(2))-methyltransferase RsmD [Coriobacteriia bacterium]